MAALPGQAQVVKEQLLKMNRALIVFIKNPILGLVKTRLAAEIGDDEALKVYQELLHYTKGVSLQLSAKRYLFYSDCIDYNDSWSIQDFTKRLQSGDDLGARMNRAFEEVGEEKKVIIGSDCPELLSKDIEDAFDSLNRHDLVIGPANDGGYYLLGMKEVHQELFEEMEWSTSKVFQETVSRAKAAHLKVKVLRELVDLDTLEDLEKIGFKSEE